MNLSKPTLLVLVFLLMAPWAAWAEQCDDVLIRRAEFMVSKRAQLAATQLVTKETFEQLRSGVTGQMRLMGRGLASFDTYDDLDAWRRKEAGRDFYAYGLDSARAAILAGTSDDVFFREWAACQLEDAKKQPPPSLRGWVDKLEAESATIRLVLVANPGPPTAEIDVEPAATLTAAAPTVSSAGSIVERLVTVRRSSKGDVLVAARSGGTKVNVVVPGLNTESSTFFPTAQLIVSPSRVVRESASYVVSVDTREKEECFKPALSGEEFDLNTIRVTANPVEVGYWKITTKTEKEICVSAGLSAKDSSQLKALYVVILRVDKLRSRTDAGNAAKRLEACARSEEKTVEESEVKNTGKMVDIYNREAGAPRGSPWSFSFISYCIKQAGLDGQLPLSAYGPQLWANAVKAGVGIQAAELQRTGDLRVGDIYFSGSLNSVGPAGIIIEISAADKTFTGIEGNVIPDGSTQGDGVFRKKRRMSDIKVGIARFPDVSSK